MREYIAKHDHQILRILEILPGFVSWNLILFPYWGILVFPEVVAYFILIFNVYWFYQSLQIAISSIISHTRMQATKLYDWMADVKGFPDYKKVRHIVIIPIYKEPIHILERTLESLARQKLPTNQIIPVLAMEKNEPEEDHKIKAKILTSKFGKYFRKFFINKPIFFWLAF